MSKLEKAVIALSRGDDDALSIIYDKAARLIFSTAYAIVGNYQDAEDVLQDTFVEIMNYAPSYSGGNAKAWILTMSRHIAIDVIRKRKATVSFDKQLDENIAINDDYTHLEVFDMLGRLDETERQIIIYRIYAKLPYKNIADVMGISVSSAQKKYQRALQKLKENYHEN
ncbi:MAG: RNA polymerase sigma factor [Oscillospiraceae bacterium]|nr:RNA polymerase sigma factor [Oscillospiraceae bacterium]